MKRFLSTAAVVTIVVISAGYTRATEYRYTTIAPPVPGINYNYSDAGEITDAGVIVGQYLDPDGAYHPFVLEGGVYTFYDHPNATARGSSALGINSLGQIVGDYDAAVGDSRGYMRDGDVYTDIVPYANSPDTRAMSINDSGLVVGWYVDHSGGGHGYLFDGTNYTVLDDPNAVDTYAYGINNAGVIVGGGWGGSDFLHGFVRDVDGTYTTFQLSGWPAEAFGINDLGQIVGRYGPSPDDHYGFVLSGGLGSTPDMLQVPGATITEVYGINNLGQVVGTYTTGTYADGTWRGFLAIPIPEPTTLLLALMALAGSVRAARSTS